MATFRELLAGRGPIFFDGAMGTMLQRLGEHATEEVHRRYAAAGAQVISANTFSLCAGDQENLEAAVQNALALARKGIGKKKRLAALDLGPTGKLLEPLGDFSFDEAYERFRRAAVAGEKAGADLVILETFSDLKELRSAVLAVKENTGLPIVASVTFSAASGGGLPKMLTGADPLTAVTYLEALDPEVIGWNCGGGLADAAALTAEFCRYARKPVLVQPNAGLPETRDGVDTFPLKPREFAAAQRLHRRMGAKLLGGCCGTTPDHIAAMISAVTPWDEKLEEGGGGCCGISASPDADYGNPGDGAHNPLSLAELFSALARGRASLHGEGGAKRRGGRTLRPGVRGEPSRRGGGSPPSGEKLTATRVCSGSLSVEIGGKAGCVIIGERLNPTGKKRLQQALREGDFSPFIDEAAAQIQGGAKILDVNVGVPGIDEKAAMTALVQLLQRTFTVPLQIDSNDPAVIDAALRVYNGKALVNSVNGKKQSMDAILPLVKKYGAAVVALCLDEGGIPAAAAERVKIAEKIIREAATYGIRGHDIVVDTLTMTVCTDPAAARETLGALALVKETFGKEGVKTCLGVSNVSFGLPGRPLITSRFFAQALAAGLDAAIANPLSPDLMISLDAHRTLWGLDKNCAEWIRIAPQYGNLDTAGPGRAGKSVGPGRTADSTGGKNSLGSGNAGGPADVQDTETVTASLVPKAVAGAAEVPPLPEGSARFAGLQDIIIHGYMDRAAAAAAALLQSAGPLEIIEGAVIPALDRVGAEYEGGTFFLPQLLLAADTVAAVFPILKAAMAKDGVGEVNRGTILLATVAGDVHDIGKNIARALLENYGYTIVDLGKDVGADRIVQEVLEKKIRLVGLSALMTTTVLSMEETIKALKAAAAVANTEITVMVGGAVLTADYAKRIGADFFVKDAMAGVAVAKAVFGGG